jgi:tetratricopeptide (TPR) repeat protein
MSNQPPKKPEQKPLPGAKRPGQPGQLVSREVHSVADAIPTEDEGDALFDKLFGDVLGGEDDDGGLDDLGIVEAGAMSQPAPRLPPPDQAERTGSPRLPSLPDRTGTPLVMGPRQAPVALRQPPGDEPPESGRDDEMVTQRPSGDDDPRLGDLLGGGDAYDDDESLDGPGSYGEAGDGTAPYALGDEGIEIGEQVELDGDIELLDGADVFDEALPDPPPLSESTPLDFAAAVRPTAAALDATARFAHQVVDEHDVPTPAHQELGLDDDVLPVPSPREEADTVNLEDRDLGDGALLEADYGRSRPRAHDDDGMVFTDAVIEEAEGLEAFEDAAVVEVSVDEVPVVHNRSAPRFSGDVLGVQSADRQPAHIEVVDEGSDESAVFGGGGPDAVTLLVQAGERDDWVERADWLYRDAPADPPKRAETLLVISEIYAMAGELERAESTAREALELAPSSPMVHRQLRGVLMMQARWAEVGETLEAEGRLAPTLAAKSHAFFFAAEVARLAQGDEDAAAHRLDLAARASPEDPRPQLGRLMRALASSDDVPEAPARGELAAAILPALQALRSLRSEGAEGELGSSHAALLAARAALRGGDVLRTLAALRSLASHPELTAGASWLIHALGAPHRSSRPEALAALEAVIEGTHGALASRAVAARALELGNDDAASRVAAVASGALSPSERLLIAALTGRAPDDLAALASEAADNEALAALTTACVSTLDASGALPAAGGEAPLGGAAAAAQRLGHELARSARQAAPAADATGLGEALRYAAEELLGAEPQNGVARAVLLEDAWASRDIDRVATTLLESADMAGGLSRERALAGAVLAELAGNQEQTLENLERVLSVAPHDEAALRMQLGQGDPNVGAASLLRFAESVDDPLRSALAFTEAGLRLMDVEGQEADGEGVLRRAGQTQPDIPLAPFLGLYVAQALGDVEGEAFWHEQRRVVAVEPGDGVPDMVRQALRLPAEESAARASLLDEAYRAKSDDYSLRDLHEQASGISDDRASWLLERAGRVSDRAAAVALEAALLCELGGNFERAAQCAARAIELGDSRLGPLFARRYALLGHRAEAVLEDLHSLLRQTRDGRERRELYELISRIERKGRNDWQRAAEALRSIIADAPQDLAALHDLEALLARAGSDEGMEDVALAIARVVEGPEAVAHAMLAARLRLAQGRWDETYEAVQIAYSVDRPSVWALRQMAAHARQRRDYATAASIARTLAASTDNPAEKATLLLRALEAHVDAGDDSSALELFAEVLERWPRHPVALLSRAALLERTASANEAAEAYEELAAICQAPRERAAQLYKAASLWLSLDDRMCQAEGRRLLEAVVDIDPAFEDSFERLRAIYLARGAKRELADLLGARIERVSDPTERFELEVMRGKMLAEVGSASEARFALSAALEANPDNPEALSAYAQVCAVDKDWDEVERTLVRLGRLVSDPMKQVDIYLRLGNLYDEHLPNLERAEQAYQQVLKLQPTNAPAREKLVGLALRAGHIERALEAQQELVNEATTTEEKCSRTVRLAEIHEAAGDVKQAEQILVKARRTWAREPDPVRALYQFYRRTGQDPAADLLLERAGAEVRRGLGAGRFEGPLFAMAVAVAELKGQGDAATVADATLAAIEGRPSHVDGAGPLAGALELDDLLAPDAFTPAFRMLLRATGWVMDNAATFDLAGLRAKPLTPNHAAVMEQTRAIAAGYGLPEVNVVATNALGPVCIPARAMPPTVCFGLPLVASDQTDVREFLIHRALKVVQSQTAALSRTAPIDLWPLLAAYLKLHNPAFEATGVDPGKVQGFLARMREVAPAHIDPQLGLYAGEVIASIGNRASTLNSLSNSWGSRAALLAVGDPGTALDAVAFAHCVSSGPPQQGADRVRWIGRQAEARDLVVFSLSDEYATLRSRLSLEAIESIEAVPIED